MNNQSSSRKKERKISGTKVQPAPINDIDWKGFNLDFSFTVSPRDHKVETAKATLVC